MPLLQQEPASLSAPIAPGIERWTFQSPFDGTPQTFLLKDFRTGPDTPLLLLYLHGALSHQEQGMTAGIYQNAFGRWGEELARRSALYVCPEYRGNSWMGPAAEADIATILRLLKARFAPQKTILSGGSMGGTSTLIYAARHPGDLDGAIALCPATAPAEMEPRFPDHFITAYGGSSAQCPAAFQERTTRHHPGALESLPLAIIHGDNDQIIPIHHSRRLMERLGPAPFRYYEEQPGGHHDSPINYPLAPLLDFVLSASGTASTKA